MTTTLGNVGRRSLRLGALSDRTEGDVGYSEPITVEDESDDDSFLDESSSDGSLSMRDVDFRHGQPPTSCQTLTELPRARLLPRDKKLFAHDETECSVCARELTAGIMLARLPCGHLYHFHCVVSWLSLSCFCPLCKFEMPTSDPHYERGRMERMKDRKVVKCSCNPAFGHKCFFRDPNKSLSEQVELS